MPGPMTIIDSTLDAHYGDEQALAADLADALNFEAKALGKRGRLRVDDAVAAHDVIRQIPVRLLAVDIRQALPLAFRFGLYAYDAYFLQCALNLGCPLITLDGRMQQVANKLEIQTLG